MPAVDVLQYLAVTRIAGRNVVRWARAPAETRVADYLVQRTPEESVTAHLTTIATVVDTTFQLAYSDAGPAADLYRVVPRDAQGEAFLASALLRARETVEDVVLVTGRVADAAGKPVANAVILVRADPTGPISAGGAAGLVLDLEHRSFEDGSYQVPVLPGIRARVLIPAAGVQATVRIPTGVARVALADLL